jgi:transposase
MKQITTGSPTNKNNEGSEGVRPVRARRMWPAEEKRRIVEATFARGASVAVIARRNDLNANMLFMWRRDYRAGKLGGGKTVAGFIPVGIVNGNAVTRPPLPPSPVKEERRRRKNVSLTTIAASGWLTEVELRNGVKVRFGGGVEEKDMRSMLALVCELA